MKIKSRDQRIIEYNTKYKNREMDTMTCIREYLSKQKNPDKWINKARNKAIQILEQREYESIKIVMYEYPMKTDRPRTFNNHTFSPNAAANKTYFEKALKQVLSDIKLINTPASICIDAYMEMPTNVKPDEVILFEAKLLNPVDKPDYDNIGKCYTDMLTDILISDDDIFWHGEINKWYSLLPRVEIILQYIIKHESEYVYKKLKARKTIKKGIESGRILLEKI